MRDIDPKAFLTSQIGRQWDTWHSLDGLTKTLCTGTLVGVTEHPILGVRPTIKLKVHKAELA